MEERAFTVQFPIPMCSDQADILYLLQSSVSTFMSLLSTLRLVNSESYIIWTQHILVREFILFARWSFGDCVLLDAHTHTHTEYVGVTSSCLYWSPRS